MRLIDADTVLYALVEEGHNNATKYGFRLGDTIKFTPTQVDEIVSRMPTIEERKTGKWMSVSNETQTWHHCSECHYQQYEKTKFCANCGADMRGGQNG